MVTLMLLQEVGVWVTARPTTSPAPPASPAPLGQPGPRASQVGWAGQDRWGFRGGQVTEVMSAPKVPRGLQVSAERGGARYALRGS